MSICGAKGLERMGPLQLSQSWQEKVAGKGTSALCVCLYLCVLPPLLSECLYICPSHAAPLSLSVSHCLYLCPCCLLQAS